MYLTDFKIPLLEGTRDRILEQSNNSTLLDTQQTTREYLTSEFLPQIDSLLDEFVIDFYNFITWNPKLSKISTFLGFRTIIFL